MCVSDSVTSHLGAETTPETVLQKRGFAEETAALTGLPVVMTTVEESLYPALKDEIPDLFPLTLQKRW